MLAVVAGTLGTLNATQGPRVSSTEVNVQSLVARAGGRVLVHSNQPLARISPSQVRISPAAEADVSVDQNTVTVQFATSLDYDTDYTVSIDSRGASTGVEARLSVAFTTPDIAVATLQRDIRLDAAGEDRPDRILRSGLSGSASDQTLFEAPRIQEYVTTGDLLAVVTLDDDDTPTLIVASASDGTQTIVDAGAARTVGQLHASSGGEPLFGYVLDAGYGNPDGPQNALFLYDPSAGSGLPTPVTGIGGHPLPVMDWTFVPGTASIVVQAEDQQLYLIDTLDTANPTPLGQHAEMRGFVPGSARLVVADPLSGSIIDLAAGSTTTLDLPEPTLFPDYYPGKLVVLGDDRYIEQYTSTDPDAADGGAASAITMTDPEGSRELYRTASTGSRIDDFCLSDNGQYLAVQVVSAEGTPDGYPVVFAYSATTTYFVRVADGIVQRSVNGILPDWCS